MASASVLLAGAILLSGCSVNPPLRIADGMPGTGAVLVPGVPFHPQTEFQCGPAALATVLGASERPVAPEALAPRVFLPGRKGSLQLELLAATRREGRIPYVVERSPEALFDEVGDGRPVLVLQNLWVRSLPRWHYAVVTGADPAGNRLLLNSGDRQGLRMRAQEFLRTWDWAGRWGMVVLRPGELPARADPARYLLAVADFEKVAGAEAAVPAYRAALERWPEDPRPHLALGNHAYAGKQLPAAVRHYRDGLAKAPGDPVLGNNLASVLGEMGCKAEARAALEAARAGLPADSPWQARLRETAAELEAGKAPRDPACAAR